jgi:hypothetical protein
MRERRRGALADRLTLSLRHPCGHVPHPLERGAAASPRSLSPQGLLARAPCAASWSPWTNYRWSPRSRPRKICRVKVSYRTKSGGPGRTRRGRRRRRGRFQSCTRRRPQLGCPGTSSRRSADRYENMEATGCAASARSPPPASAGSCEAGRACARGRARSAGASCPASRGGDAASRGHTQRRRPLQIGTAGAYAPDPRPAVSRRNRTVRGGSPSSRCSAGCHRRRSCGETLSNAATPHRGARTAS